MSSKKSTLVIVYEENQIPGIASLLSGTVDTEMQVIALDLWASEALRARNIPHTLFSDESTLFSHPRTAFMVANTAAREWHRIAAMEFFSHHGVSIAESEELDVQSYLGKLWNARDIVRRVVVAHPECGRIVIPYSTEPVGRRGSVTSFFQIRAFPDAALLVGKELHLGVELLGQAPALPQRLLAPSPRVRTLVLKFYNMLMGLIARHRAIRAFASDYWRYLAPYVEKMADLELVLMDRSEIRAVSLTTLFRRRVRIMHPHDYVTSRMRRDARARVAEFREQWNSARPVVAKKFAELVNNDIPWESVEPAFSYLIEVFSERVVLDIEATEKILKSERINRVLLRASVSAQHHFFILAQVAALLGIPSIEVQHGIETQAPHSLYSRLKASYIAAYGTNMTKRMAHDHGYAAERIRATGSPRFDRYTTSVLSSEDRAARLRVYGLDPSRPVMLCAVPAESWYLYPSYFTSSEIGDTLVAMHELQRKNPDIQCIFKFRAGDYSGPRVAYMQRLFSNGGVFCTDAEDLRKLFQVSDVLVTPRSTLQFEATAAGIPTILFPVRTEDREFVDFYKNGFLIPTSREEFEEVATPLLKNAEERVRTLSRTRTFLEQEYSFDGHATERTIALIREALKSFPASDQ